MAELTIEEQIRQKIDLLSRLEDFLKVGKITIAPELEFDIPSEIEREVREYCRKLRKEIKELTKSLKVES